jgi:transcriptional regulator with GAF, ATPase, and Fis domain
VARAIHFSGDQSKSPFIPVNCSSIPNELAESLFFGHVKGAFSGATSDRKGYFQLADGGTLFLDEVGDMPMELQSVLLRVLEDGEVRPVGSSRSERVQVRVVAASNVNFQQSISNGTFRKDLFFRLARFTIEVPPLRERQDDVPLLVKHFLELFADELNIPQPEVSVDALQRLCQYTYPGNIRELKNILERAVIESGNEGQIDKSALHFFYEETGFDAVEDSETEVSVSELPPDEQNDETTILDYVKTHGIINNTVCRQLLDVDRNRSSYLLRKLEKQDKLISEGQGRWAQYRLSNSDANQTQRSC